MAGSFITNDLSSFLNTSDFATAATFGNATIDVILDREYLAQEVGGEVAIEGTAPLVHARESDVSSASHGDTITISNVAYTIVGIEPDFTGMTVLRLRV